MLTADSGPTVADAFGLGAGAALTGPVASGHVGRVWRLTTDDGAFAVKEPLTATEGDARVAAAAALDAVFQERAVAEGVPAPSVIRSPSGGVVEHVDGALVRVHEWVDVEAPDRRLYPAEVGRVVAGIHRAGGPATGPVEDWYSRPVGAQKWQTLLEELDRAGAPFAADLASALPGMVRAEALVEPPGTLRLCHRDLWSDNVLRATAGGVVVLDWENSGPADPANELMGVLFEFGCGEPDRYRELYDAYLAAGGPGRVQRPVQASMLFAELGHITELACRRWLAASSEDEREHLAEWAREGIEEPVTVPAIEAILDAVAGMG